MLTTHISQIQLAADGRAWVDGELTADADSVDDARRTAIRAVMGKARTVSRTVRVTATDPDGEVWRILVHPSGRVEEDQGAAHLDSDPDAVTVPRVYRGQAGTVRAAIEIGDEMAGLRTARALHESVTADVGPDHPYALRARELAAFAALNAELPGEACEMYADVAKGWAELGSSAYWHAAQSAYYCWHQVKDAGRAVYLGDVMSAMLRLGGAAAMPTLRAVLARVDRLTGTAA